MKEKSFFKKLIGNLYLLGLIVKYLWEEIVRPIFFPLTLGIILFSLYIITSWRF